MRSLRSRLVLHRRSKRVHLVPAWMVRNREWHERMPHVQRGDVWIDWWSDNLRQVHGWNLLDGIGCEQLRLVPTVRSRVLRNGRGKLVHGMLGWNLWVDWGREQLGDVYVVFSGLFFPWRSKLMRRVLGWNVRTEPWCKLVHQLRAWVVWNGHWRGFVSSMCKCLPILYCRIVWDKCGQQYLRIVQRRDVLILHRCILVLEMPCGVILIIVWICGMHSLQEGAVSTASVYLGVQQLSRRILQQCHWRHLEQWLPAAGQEIGHSFDYAKLCAILQQHVNSDKDCGCAFERP
mmetsp:Transcript_53238/g.140893  ORF Transcript_53238/g.140893 Transcript_53238/m.140893 type:complete len:290 (-) Transcript_53238:1389-2258(-)